MLVYEKQTPYGYVYEVYPYGSFFSAIGNFFSSIGHGISSAFHKITHAFSTAPSKMGTTNLNKPVTVGSTIGGGAYSVLEGGSSASSLAQSISNATFGQKAWSSFNATLSSNLLGTPKPSSTGGWAKNPFSSNLNLNLSTTAGTTGTASTPPLTSVLGKNFVSNYTKIGVPKQQSSFLGDLFKQLTQTAVGTLVEAGKLKLQQSIYKSLGLLPKQPKVVYAPVQTPMQQPQTTTIIIEKPHSKPQMQPRQQSSSATRQQAEPSQKQATEVTASMFGVSKQYLFLFGGLLLVALLASRR
jgi:hypothetical protein